MSILYNRLYDLCLQNGITGYKMCADNGLSKNLMTELKSGRKKGINAETANKLASYFGVTVAYLLGVDDQPEKKEAPSLSEDAVSSPYVKELIRLVDSASPEK